MSKFNTNSLTVTLVIKKIPPSGGITIGQIHDRGNIDPYGNIVDNLPLLKLMYENKATLDGQECGGCLYAEMRKTPAKCWISNKKGYCS